MNRYYILGRAMATKSLKLARRYIVNTAVGVLTLYLFFAFIFFGGGFVMGDLLARSIDQIIVGYFLFTMAVSAYAGLTHDLTEEAQWGTLEQLTMSPVGFTQLVTVKTIVNLVGTFVVGAVLLTLMLVTTMTPLYIKLIPILVLGVLTLIPVVGIGFIFGGAALVYKQIEKVFSIVQLSFIGLLAVPVPEYPVLKLLPMALGNHLLQRVMVDGVSLSELPLFDLGLLVGKAVAYVIIGLFVFQYATSVARKRGILGHY